MKKLLFALMIICSSVGNAQKGISYAAVGYEDIIDTAFEKIIDKKWMDFHDGSTPGMYYVVKYDYGQGPPEFLELVKSFLTHGFPDTIRGWIVAQNELINTSGDCAFLCMDLTQTCTNKINSKLPIYVERMDVNLGCNSKPDEYGNSDKFSIEIYSTKEEMERRDKLIRAKYK